MRSKRDNIYTLSLSAASYVDMLGDNLVCVNNLKTHRYIS